MSEPVVMSVFAALAILAVLLSAIALTNLRWMLDAWLHPEATDERGFVGPDDDRRSLSFSLVVPARHEEAVLADTLEGLAEMHYPCFEVIVVVGHDDPGTHAVADRVAALYPDKVHVVVDKNGSKNKPKALNTALAVCQGDIVGIFDAEDEVSRDLLANVDDCFRRTSADVVQGGVQLMNYQSSWYALRNVLEYFFYFGSRLHLHARQEFLPLGGNTVFFRRDMLDHAGGWDPECLAEDCEIGVRLSSGGAKTVVAYDAALATREEAPTSFGAFVKQRTRWNQGFLQVLKKGEWRRLPLGQRLRAMYILAMPFIQAGFVLLLPLQLASVFVLKIPVLLAMASFVPLMLLVMTVGVEIVGLHEFGTIYGCRPRLWDYARLVVSSVPYQITLGIAAARAVLREFRGSRGWEKTSHTNVHRTVVAPEAAGR